MLPNRSKSLSMAARPRGPSLMEGMLEKKKTFGSSRFFCSLQDGNLYYGEDKGRENVIDISHAQAVREGKAKFSFEIITSSRTHTFTADSQSTRDKWITSLREMMQISSRKNSSLSYIESANSDEEHTPSPAANPPIASQRPSVMSATPTSPLKPGSAASLPVGFTKRTNASVVPSLGDDPPAPHRTSEATPASEPSSESASHGANHEIKEEERNAGLPPMSAGVGETKACDCISEEGECGAVSEEDNGERGTPNGHSAGESADDDSPFDACQIDAMTASGLYANSVDAWKLLDHPKAEPDEMASNSAVTYANDSDIKTFLDKQRAENGEARSVSASEGTRSEAKGGREGPTGEAESESAEDKTWTREDTFDEESDDVFAQPCNQSEESGKAKEVKPPEKPVLRRPSQQVPNARSSATDVPLPQTAAVELDADFLCEPIPDLPHPRLEDSWSSAFAEIRAMLSDGSARTENATLTSVFKEQQGRAVDSLKHFLKSIECG